MRRQRRRQRSIGREYCEMELIEGDGFQRVKQVASQVIASDADKARNNRRDASGNTDAVFSTHSDFN